MSSTVMVCRHRLAQSTGTGTSFADSAAQSASSALLLPSVKRAASAMCTGELSCSWRSVFCCGGEGRGIVCGKFSYAKTGQHVACIALHCRELIICYKSGGLLQAGSNAELGFC